MTQVPQQSVRKQAQSVRLLELSVNLQRIGAHCIWNIRLMFRWQRKSSLKLLTKLIRNGPTRKRLLLIVSDDWTFPMLLLPLLFQPHIEKMLLRQAGMQLNGLKKWYPFGKKNIGKTVHCGLGIKKKTNHIKKVDQRRRI